MNFVPKIIQIIPADKWEVVYEDSKTKEKFSSPLVCFALMEDKDGWRYIEPMNISDGTIIDSVAYNAVEIKLK